MIRLADYIMKRLVEYGVRHVFMIPGGGAMHLDDAIGCNKDLTFTCSHHEQACAIGAEGYARASGKMGVCIVTSGPGGTNTLTGVTGHWTDSIPVLYLSGQIKTETSIESCRELGLRQLGDQELNIVDVVRPITKFVAFIKDPQQIRYTLEKAIYLATHGRPGPVWLDIPLNVQSAMIDESTLPGYDPREDEVSVPAGDLKRQVAQVVDLLKQSQRPVFVAGHGIRLSKAQTHFMTVIERLGIPVLSTFNGMDLLPTAHNQFIGRIGTIGNRAGNFALQNSDLLLSVGTRNNIRQVSYNWNAYARAAKKIVVDVDPAELKKPTLQPDFPICADAKAFLEELEHQLQGLVLPQMPQWLAWCQERKRLLPRVTEEQKKPLGKINLYAFSEALTEELDEGAVVVAGNGSACVGLFQAGVVKKSQRMFWNSGCATMGYDLPAAIGACMASGGRQDVICIAGDGSLQMNIQELATVAYKKLPIKLFYLNNKGFISMKQTMNSFFNGRVIASDEKTGIWFPDIRKIAEAYGIPSVRLERPEDTQAVVRKVLSASGPIICEVMLPENYIFEPKLSSEKKPDGRMVSKPLEDMFPFLSREEFQKHMIIPPLNEE